MSTNILMPALSPTMTEGKLSRWLKKEGDEVKSGDLLAEIETDKATMEVEAVDEGFLAKIVVPEGTEGVAVNAVIAVLSDTKGEVVAAPQATPAVPKAAATVGETPVPTGPTAPAAQPHVAEGRERVFASPLARRMAQQAGIDLSAIKGSGPNGRIVRADLETAPVKPAAAPIAVPVTAPAARPKSAPAALAPVITAPHKKIPNSSMRQTIARRLLESTQTTPTFFISANCEIDAMLKLRAELNAKSPKEGPGAFRLSLNDLIIKACAKALRIHPNINSSYTEEAMIAYDDVDISMAVAVPDGLITPIIRKADQLGLAAISNLTKDLGARAKAGKLKPEEYQGGGFAISNLGMYGVPSFTAIINPPQSAILAVGAGEKRAIVKDDAVVMATMMTITLTCDHRVFDGAQSAEFMTTLKDIIEDPLNLLL